MRGGTDDEGDATSCRSGRAASLTGRAAVALKSPQQPAIGKVDHVRRLGGARVTAREVGGDLGLVRASGLTAWLRRSSPPSRATSAPPGPSQAAAAALRAVRGEPGGALTLRRPAATSAPLRGASNVARVSARGAGRLLAARGRGRRRQREHGRRPGERGDDRPRLGERVPPGMTDVFVAGADARRDSSTPASRSTWSAGWPSTRTPAPARGREVVCAAGPRLIGEDRRLGSAATALRAESRLKGPRRAKPLSARSIKPRVRAVRRRVGALVDEDGDGVAEARFSKTARAFSEPGARPPRELGARRSSPRPSCRKPSAGPPPWRRAPR